MYIRKYKCIYIHISQIAQNNSLKLTIIIRETSENTNNPIKNVKQPLFVQYVAIPGIGRKWHI